ncbi:MaoC family dehydratase [Tomitella fengzijianii]|uniref:Dehydratase n=1 Tax=Tomitella fengzijianii TaxID=2597660 RepID=A0A516X8S2_9ACTN|nr:dehydratase [Tomitella fengzijianii]
MLASYAKAAAGLLPLPSGGDGSLPQRTLELPGYRVDPDHLAAYARVCGLRLADTLPLTYGYVLTFPSVMKLMTARDFPLPAIGMVHVGNRIEQLRPVSASEPLDLRTHAEGLGPHRKGTQVRLVSEISADGAPVWRQTSTFLKIGGGSGEDASQRPAQKDAAPADPGEPTTTLRADQKIISRYASVSGDRNPIHVSSLGAKAFGFPRTIAHGMWSAAAALGALEGRVPEHAVYDVRFGKPMVLPAKADEYVRRSDDGWALELRHPKKQYPFLTATLAEG